MFQSAERLEARVMISEASNAAAAATARMRTPVSIGVNLVILLQVLKSGHPVLPAAAVANRR